MFVGRTRPRKANRRARRTCTSSPGTSRRLSIRDHGPIFFENGDRPAYVNSIAVGKDGTVYALTRITQNGKTRTDLMSIPRCKREVVINRRTVLKTFLAVPTRTARERSGSLLDQDSRGTLPAAEVARISEQRESRCGSAARCSGRE